MRSCDFGNDYIVDLFAELACKLLGESEPYLFDEAPAIESRRTAAALRTLDRIGRGREPLRRDLGVLPGGALLEWADRLDALEDLVELRTFLRQTAVMWAQDWLDQQVDPVAAAKAWGHQ